MNECTSKVTDDDLKRFIDCSKQLLLLADMALDRGDYDEALTITSGVGKSLMRYADSIVYVRKTKEDQLQWLNNRITAAYERMPGA